MKFILYKLGIHFRTAKGHGNKHIKKRPYIVPIAGLIVGLVIVGVAFVTHRHTTLAATDSHVVFVSDEGKQQTVATKSQTVGDLLDRLPKLNLIPEDVVEPSRDTPILEDNFRINIYRARPVTITDTAQKIVTLTAQRSPRVVAQQAGLEVYPEDGVSFQVGTLKENIIGEKVVINRAVPVSLNLYGTPVTVRTRTATVADMLREKQIKLATGDTVQPAPTTPITPDLAVFVVRNGTQIVTVTQPIPAAQQVIQDNSLSFGTTVVRQQGSSGVQALTYQVQTENGKETGRTLIQQAVIQEPVPQIIARGQAIDIPADKTSIMAAAGISSSDYAYVNYIVSRESGWCPTKWQGQHTCPAYYEPLYAPTAGIGYGLCQSTPGSKMASAGADWQTNAVTQLRWCSGYSSRYGGWAGSYEHWLAHSNW